MRTRLAGLAATIDGQSRQVDVYYNHPARDFLAHDVVSEWLRLRTDHDGDGPPVSSLNFKQWLPIGSPDATHAAEYESVIQDHDAVSSSGTLYGIRGSLRSRRGAAGYALGVVIPGQNAF